MRRHATAHTGRGRSRGSAYSAGRDLARQARAHRRAFLALHQVLDLDERPAFLVDALVDHFGGLDGHVARECRAAIVRGRVQDPAVLAGPAGQVVSASASNISVAEKPGLSEIFVPPQNA